MHTYMELLRSELKNIWRHRWSALALATLISLLGWAGLGVTPNTYEAQARVYVDATSALKPLLNGIAVDPNVDAQLNYVRTNMLSTPALAKVATQTDLALRASSAKGRENIVENLKKQIMIDAAVSGDKGSTDKLYTITYQDHKRAMALAVVTKLLNTFVESSMGAGREGDANAQQFLKDQIKDTENKLSADEARMADFKRTHAGMVPGQAGDYFSKLEAQRDALKHAKGQLAIAQLKQSALDKEMHGQLPYSAGSNKDASAASGGDVATRLQKAQTELDNLRLQYTDKHPEVQAMQDTVAQLTAQQQAQEEAVKKGDPAAAVASGLASNPVYQQLQLSLNQAEVEVAGLKGEVADHEKSIAELDNTKNQAPEVEAQFKELDRDYTVTRTEYDSLVERLNRANLSESASEAGSINFRVIDPPFAKIAPIKPDRPLLTIEIFGGALFAGLAFGWLRAQMRSVFETVKQLADETGKMVLGSVSAMGTEPTVPKGRRQALSFIGAFCLLLVAFGFAMVVALNGTTYPILNWI